MSVFQDRFLLNSVIHAKKLSSKWHKWILKRVDNEEKWVGFESITYRHLGG